MNRAHIVAPPIVADIEVVEHVSFSAVEKFVRRSSLNCALNLGQSTYRWLTSKSRFTDESLPLKQITKTTPPVTTKYTPLNNRAALYLVFSVCISSTLAATPESVLPIWLRTMGNPNPGSREVFEAFHSPGEPVKMFTSRSDAPLFVPPPAIYPNEFRTFDGKKNNVSDLGAAGKPDLRTTTIGYGDGVGSPAGADRLSAREISNLVNAQSDIFPNPTNISSFVWAWGQLVDHDMTLTRSAVPAEDFDIPVPRGDPQFDPANSGKKVLPFERSEFATVDGIRQQLNANTALLDASMVYGSGEERADALRTLDGTGHLKTSDGNLLPFNVDGLPNQPSRGPTAKFFLAGDVRVNENSGLAALQTLLMREHNFWADSIKTVDPTLDDDGIFFRARAIVGAEVQLITYRDFIPILLGPDALTPYAGYNAAVDPSVALVFSTAAFRVGHTLLPPTLLTFNKAGVQTGEIALGSTLFQPNLIVNSGGIEPYLRGLAKQVPQEVDAYIIDAMRNFLVGGTQARGFDLAALNIQRGRDHGLPGYNQVRIDYGLTPKASFADITSNLDIQTKLASAYSSPDDMDFWVGGISEDHFNGGLMGETFFTILKEQFQRTRDGDRFWYESYLDPTTLATVQAQTLTIIIRRNAAIGQELQDDAFHVPTAR